jgi:hypothetical protein
VLGAEFDGVLVRDGWAPYRQFGQAAHQTCLAHYADRQIMPISALTPAVDATTATVGSA